MKKLLICLFALLLVSTGVVFAGSRSVQKSHINFAKKNILIAYYSLSGNTKYVAEHLQAQIGGDMFEITTKNKYPTEQRLLKEVTKYQNENDIFPEINNTIDISKYDIIFVGTPVWYSTMAMPVKTFLSVNNFKGKTIIPFITHGGGGWGDIDIDMDDLSNGRVVQNVFAVQGKGTANLDNDLKKWIKSLKK